MVLNQPLSEWFTMTLLTTASMAFPEAGCASISTLVLCVNPSTDTHRHRSKHTEHIHRTHTHRLDALAGIGWDDWDRQGLAGSEFWVGTGSELGRNRVGILGWNSGSEVGILGRTGSDWVRTGLEQDRNFVGTFGRNSGSELGRNSGLELGRNWNWIGTLGWNWVGTGSELVPNWVGTLGQTGSELGRNWVGTGWELGRNWVGTLGRNSGSELGELGRSELGRNWVGTGSEVWVGTGSELGRNCGDSVFCPVIEYISCSQRPHRKDS